MPRFSQLKKQIESLFDPKLEMEFCCSVYPKRSKTRYAHNSIPRFYVKLRDEIIWDYPKNFPIKKEHYAYWTDNNGISDLVRAYIETPKESLWDKDFTDYEVKLHEKVALCYDLSIIFLAADRRFGKSKILSGQRLMLNKAVQKILDARFGADPNRYTKYLISEIKKIVTKPYSGWKIGIAGTGSPMDDEGYINTAVFSPKNDEAVLAAYNYFKAKQMVAIEPVPDKPEYLYLFKIGGKKIDEGVF